MTVFALLGAGALYLMYAWMLCAIIASYLSGRKGFGEKAGLATGLLLFVLAPIVWLVWPAKPESKWKRIGPFGRGDEKRGATAKGGSGAAGGTGATAAE